MPQVTPLTGLPRQFPEEYSQREVAGVLAGVAGRVMIDASMMSIGLADQVNVEENCLYSKDFFDKDTIRTYDARAMLTEPLPTMLDVRKAAVRGVGVSGVLKPLDLKRFRPLLGGDEGSISVEMAFSRDEESRYLVHVSIEAEIVVTCQRCLDAMPDRLVM